MEDWEREPIGLDEVNVIRCAEWKRIVDDAWRVDVARSSEDMPHGSALDGLRHFIGTESALCGEPAFENARLSIRFEALSIIELAIRDPRMPAAASDATRWVFDQITARHQAAEKLVPKPEPSGLY